MARAVYLHIGTPKSGTTYLQQLLWTNKAGLAKAGLLMAGDSREDSLHAMMAIQQRRKLASMSERAQQAWARLVAEIAEWPGNALISHEFLGMSTQEQAAGAIADLAPADVHVVLTARDYLAMVPAVWQEAVKIGSAPSYEQFLTAMADGWDDSPWSWSTCDVAAVLDRWGATLPAERVHVVTTPPPGSPPELLWHRFAAACAIPPDDVLLPEGGRNESLGRAEAELLMRLNSRWPAEIDESLPDRHRWVRGFLGQDVLVPSLSPKVSLPRHAAPTFRERAIDAIEQVRRRGYDVQGDLDDLVSIDIDALDSTDAGVAADEVMDVALETIVRLVGRYRERALAAERRQHAQESARRDPRGERRAARGEGSGPGKVRRVAREARRRLAGNGD